MLITRTLLESNKRGTKQIQIKKDISKEGKSLNTLDKNKGDPGIIFSNVVMLIKK